MQLSEQIALDRTTTAQGVWACDPLVMSTSSSRVKVTLHSYLLPRLVSCHLLAPFPISTSLSHHAMLVLLPVRSTASPLARMADGRAGRGAGARDYRQVLRWTGASGGRCGLTVGQLARGGASRPAALGIACHLSPCVDPRGCLIAKHCSRAIWGMIWGPFAM